MTDVGEIESGMRTKTHPRGREIALIADRQHGIVSRSQLLRLGFHPGTVRRRVAGGLLHPVHAGVYAVGHRCISREGRWMAAVLACGPTALLSHRSAAELRGFIRTSTYVSDVTTARLCRHRDSIALQRSRLIHAEDRCSEESIPVTSVARTLLDLAEVVRPWLLGRAIEEAERREVFDLGAVDRLLGRSRGRHGLRALGAALRDYRPVPFTRSELERRFLDVCRAARLPRPSVNLTIQGFEVDMTWPGHRLVVELDGHDTHRTRAAFERDRGRDIALQLAGYRVMRITDRRLDDAPDEVMSAIRSFLDRT